MAGLGVIAGAGLAWVIGLEWLEAFLIASGLVVLVGLRRLPGITPGEDWPYRTDEPHDRGVRRDVTRLSWTLHGHESRVERASIRRLRAVAALRLARRELELGAPGDAAACRRVLGDRAYAVLTAGSGTYISLEDFTATVSAVEDLAE
jgi:hypothetical protein